MKTRALCLLLVLLLLGGCAAAGQEEMVNPIGFYLRAEADGGDYDSRTGALRAQTVDLGRSDITIEEILTRYLAYAERSGAPSPFPAGLRVSSLSLEDGILMLRFNEAFSSLSGVQLTLCAAALTLTLTQIDGVDGISIRSTGSILSEDWEDVFTPDDFLFTDASSEHPEYAVQLYFLDSAGSLTAQRRMLECSEKDALPELTMNALLAGPDTGTLRRAIPAETALLDLSMDGKTCTVVLSDDFAACDTDLQSAEHAVRAIVLTLCSLDAVEAVRVQLLSGAELRNYSIAEALSPSADWLQ